MNKHVFRGECASAICADCCVEKAWDEQWQTYVYRRPPSKTWSTERPDCAREIPRGIASEGRP